MRIGTFGLIIVLADLFLIGMGAAIWAGRMPTYALPELFGLSNENALPTAYAGLKLVAIAVFLGLFSLAEAPGRARLALAVLALLLLALGLDEIASIHERVQEFLRDKVLEPADVDTRSEGKLHLEGLLLGGLLLAFIGALLPFLRSSDRWRAVETGFFAGFGLMVFGGVVVDVVPSALWPHPLWTLVEESAEFAGATILLLSLLRSLAVRGMTLEIGAALAAQDADLPGDPACRPARSAEGGAAHVPPEPSRPLAAEQRGC